MHLLRCPILNPQIAIGVDFHRDGILAHSEGRLAFIGDATDFQRQGGDPRAAPAVAGVIIPPMLDIHTHVPQWPIRGKFLDGVPENPVGGRLLAGLERNVFPAEMGFANVDQASLVIEQFRADTLAHGVVGGCVFMTVHPEAAHLGFQLLSDDWRIGPVLMDQNCPPGLRSDLQFLRGPVSQMASHYGQRLVPADRFAAACSSSLRRAAVQLAQTHGLRMQTHLAEQPAEVELVRRLYPEAASYAEVYALDGLLDCSAILAHCIHLAEEEWRLLRDSGASIAHCPVSNTLLGSGIMHLKTARRWEVPFALATDVGASPTTSLLAEARQFLTVHQDEASPQEALWRITQAPAEILGLTSRFGRLREGGTASFVVVDAEGAESADETIRKMLGMSPGTDTSIDFAWALEELRTGRARRRTVDLLTADFEDAANRVAGVSSVVVDGVERLGTSAGASVNP